MHVEVGHLYHLSNQGNNREQLFACDDDYLSFLKLVKTHLTSVCDIVAWSLIPNHFHFAVVANEASIAERANGKLMIQAFSKGVGLLQSRYATLINVAQGRTGARFKPKATLHKASDSHNGYDLTLIRYIHYNPVAAGLVLLPEEWVWSSAADYAGIRQGKLSNIPLAKSLGLLCP